jgi:hypothetical protein
MIADGLVPAASLAAQLAPAPIPAQLALTQVRTHPNRRPAPCMPTHQFPWELYHIISACAGFKCEPPHHNLCTHHTSLITHLCFPLIPYIQEVGRPLCAITSSSHSVPGGQLSFQPGTAGNDRIGMVPLERWDVELAPADNPAGGQGPQLCATAHSLLRLCCSALDCADLLVPATSYLTHVCLVSALMFALSRAEPAVRFLPGGRRPV